MKRIRHRDGTVHFSDLSRMAQSPAHYKASVERPAEARTVTSSMRVGTVAHRIVLGARLHHEIEFWDGDRRGNAWKAFEAEHAGAEIVSRSEWIKADEIATSALTDPALQPLLEAPGARTEVPLAWTCGGIECSTGGVDLIAPGLLVDLKTTRTCDLRRWPSHAFAMQYHAQLAFYLDGAVSLGLLEPDARVICAGIETAPPYAVTPLLLTPGLLDLGRRSYCLWLERLRSCEENDMWPSYTEALVEWDVPEWLKDAELGLEHEDDGEEAA